MTDLSEGNLLPAPSLYNDDFYFCSYRTDFTVSCVQQMDLYFPFHHLEAMVEITKEMMPRVSRKVQLRGSELLNVNQMLEDGSDREHFLNSAGWDIFYNGIEELSGLRWLPSAPRFDSDPVQHRPDYFTYVYANLMIDDAFHHDIMLVDARASAEELEAEIKVYCAREASRCCDEFFGNSHGGTYEEECCKMPAKSVRRHCVLHQHYVATSCEWDGQPAAQVQQQRQQQSHHAAHRTQCARGPHRDQTGSSRFAARSSGRSASRRRSSSGGVSTTRGRGAKETGHPGTRATKAGGTGMMHLGNPATGHKTGSQNAAQGVQTGGGDVPR